MHGHLNVKLFNVFQFKFLEYDIFNEVRGKITLFSLKNSYDTFFFKWLKRIVPDFI